MEEELRLIDESLEEERARLFEVQRHCRAQPCVAVCRGA